MSAASFSAISPFQHAPDCLAPLEVTYDLDAARDIFTREAIAQGPANIWRYATLLPLPKGFQPDLPVGFTPLVRAKNLGKRIGARNLYVKNDAVCFPDAQLQRSRCIGCVSQRAGFRL
jgi:threonine synthase